MGQADDPGAERLRAIYAQETLSETDVAAAIAILDASQARTYAEKLAHRHLEAALAELAAARPEPEANEALREMAHFLVKRTY